MLASMTYSMSDLRNSGLPPTLELQAWQTKVARAARIRTKPVGESYCLTHPCPPGEAQAF